MPSYHSPSSCGRCGSRKRLDKDAPQRDGKAVSARNATSHGLFARDVVLPHLGEDAAAYNALLGEFLAQIAPQNLLERHYVEKIAAGTWRLRRLHRWQAQLFEDPSLDEGERLDKLDKVLRHETALHRQIDAAVRMLGKDVAHLFATRAHAKALADWDTTPQDCKDTPAVARQIVFQTRHNLDFPPFPATDFDLNTLDTLHPTPSADPQHEICQNETAETPAADTEEAHRNVPAPPAVELDIENCQNETPSAPAPPPFPTPPLLAPSRRASVAGSRAGGPPNPPIMAGPQRSGEVGPPLCGDGGPSETEESPHENDSY